MGIYTIKAMESDQWSEFSYTVFTVYRHVCRVGYIKLLFTFYADSYRGFALLGCMVLGCVVAGSTTIFTIATGELCQGIDKVRSEDVEGLESLGVGIMASE